MRQGKHFLVAIKNSLEVERLSIPSLHMSDGSMGARAELAENEWKNTGPPDDFGSSLPCNSAVASTWNRALAGKEGEVLGEEAC